MNEPKTTLQSNDNCHLKKFVYTLSLFPEIRKDSTLIQSAVSKISVVFLYVFIFGRCESLRHSRAACVMDFSTICGGQRRARALAQTRRLSVSRTDSSGQHLLLHAGHFLYSSVHQMKHTQGCMIWIWPLTSTVDYSDCREFAASATRWMLILWNGT